MLSTLKAGLITALFPVARVILGGRRRRFRSNGVDMLIDIGESHMTLLRALGLYELRKTAEIERRLTAGSVFVDVGSSQGDFALIAARIVGPTGRVHAFEPDPDDVDGIRANVALNGFGTITVHGLALSDSDGEATLYRSSVSGWHSLVSGLEKRGETPATVPVARLDSLDLDRVDMIKIDVEGAEAAVLAGARATLERHRPIVLLDTHPSLGADVGALQAYFDDLRYDVFDSDRHASRPLPGGIPREDADLVLIPRPAGT
ncbi:FkbM family methyltransferase [Thalassobaculum sp.]|uniref:FkbM family methyltransferase n=1 Tax=Thalassobaculum sp. TaxID=2022740 RepID=UPI0032EED71C